MVFRHSSVNRLPDSELILIYCVYLNNFTFVFVPIAQLCTICYKQTDKKTIKNLLNKGQMNCSKNVLLIFTTDTSSHLMLTQEKVLGTTTK
jgi:hypothetical protein